MFGGQDLRIALHTDTRTHTHARSTPYVNMTCCDESAHYVTLRDLPGHSWHSE